MNSTYLDYWLQYGVLAQLQINCLLYIHLPGLFRYWYGNSRTVVLGMHDMRETSNAETIDVDMIIPHEDYG